MVEKNNKYVISKTSARCHSGLRLAEQKFESQEYIDVSGKKEDVRWKMSFDKLRNRYARHMIIVRDMQKVLKNRAVVICCKA